MVAFLLDFVYNTTKNPLKDLLDGRKEIEMLVKQKKWKAKNRRGILALFLIAVLLWNVQTPVFAAGNSGSIEIQLKDLGENSKREGVSFELYQVGTWNAEKSSWSLTDALKETGITQESLKNASDWDTAAKTLSKSENLSSAEKKTGSTDSSGNLEFSDLKLGIYLLVPGNMQEYGNVSPVLLTVPYTVNGVEKADISIKPKAELPKDPDPTPKPEEDKGSDGAPKPDEDKGSNTEPKSDEDKKPQKIEDAAAPKKDNAAADPVTGTSAGATASVNTAVQSKPSTGDPAQTALYAALVLAAGCFLAYRRRRVNEK